MTNCKLNSEKAEQLVEELSNRVPDTVQSILTKMKSHGPGARQELAQKYDQRKVDEDTEKLVTLCDSSYSRCSPLTRKQPISGASHSTGPGAR